VRAPDLIFIDICAVHNSHGILGLFFSLSASALSLSSRSSAEARRASHLLSRCFCLPLYAAGAGLDGTGNIPIGSYKSQQSNRVSIHQRSDVFSILLKAQRSIYLQENESSSFSLHHQ
jgi:hypothetical protein